MTYSLTSFVADSASSRSTSTRWFGGPLKRIVQSFRPILDDAKITIVLNSLRLYPFGSNSGFRLGELSGEFSGEFPTVAASLRPSVGL